MEINLNLSWPSGSGYRAFRVPSIHPAVFSVNADNYTQFQSDTLINAIELTNSYDYIKFEIFNQSGYNSIYNYEFTNVIGDSFEGQEDSTLIDSFSASELIIYPSDPIESMQQVHLKIWPKYHTYLEKNMFFNVIFNNIILQLGDANFDDLIDILDIIIIIDFIIYEQVLNDNQLFVSDLNSDEIVNIMDIIILVEFILNY